MHLDAEHTCPTLVNNVVVHPFVRVTGDLEVGCEHFCDLLLRPMIYISLMNHHDDLAADVHNNGAGSVDSEGAVVCVLTAVDG